MYFIYVSRNGLFSGILAGLSVPTFVIGYGDTNNGIFAIMSLMMLAGSAYFFFKKDDKKDDAK